MRTDQPFPRPTRPVPHDPLAEARLRVARRSWVSPAALTVFAALWIVGASAVDSSDLETRGSEWGYAFVPFFATVLVGLPLVLALLGLCCLGHLVPRTAWAASLAGALVCALVGVGLAVAASSGLATATVPADTAFALVTVGATLVLLVPLPVVWRARPVA